MENFLKSHRRFIGFIFLLIGIGFAVWLKNSFATGAGIEDRIFFVAPFMLLYGLAIVIQPRILLYRGEFHSAAPLYKFLNIVLVVVGLGLALYLRHTLFKDWH